MNKKLFDNEKFEESSADEESEYEGEEYYYEDEDEEDDDESIDPCSPENRDGSEYTYDLSFINKA
jgi:hypothetical protein